MKEERATRQQGAANTLFWSLRRAEPLTALSAEGSCVYRQIGVKMTLEIGCGAGSVKGMVAYRLNMRRRAEP